MVFTRSTPNKEYKDYSQYRSLLRHDFQYRCAYWLILEYYNGGAANFVTDHHWPQNGPHGRPDLVAVYTNLYWCCQECNSNKGDEWPEAAEYAAGYRFIDPCEEWGDHDRNWIFHRDGTLDAITNAGEYTDERLMLWRPSLQERRAQMFRDQDEVAEIEVILQQAIESERRTELEKRLAEVKRRLEPPVYDRTRRGDARPVPPGRAEETIKQELTDGTR